MGGRDLVRVLVLDYSPVDRICQIIVDSMISVLFSCVLSVSRFLVKRTKELNLN